MAKQRNAKSRWKNDSEMQKVVGKKAAKRIKVVGKMYLSNKREEVF